MESLHVNRVKDEIKNSLVNIKVIGVGGYGGNAVKQMIEEGVQGVKYVAVNTDGQALSGVEGATQIQLGDSGFGAGADPKEARKMAEDNKKKLEEVIEGSDMIFIVAGLGKGTGSGVSPVIASIAKEKGILTVAVITMPKKNDGEVRNKTAAQALKELKPHVDTLIIIENDKLEDEAYKKLSFKQRLAKFNGVLKEAVISIVTIIVYEGYINVDFADITSILRGGGIGYLGVGIADGEGRAEKAAKQAISNNLLDTRIRGAERLIIAIFMPEENESSEGDKMEDCIRNEVGKKSVNYIHGVFDVLDLNKEKPDAMGVIVIATGLPENPDECENPDEGKVSNYEKEVNNLKNVKLKSLPKLAEKDGNTFIPDWMEDK